LYCVAKKRRSFAAKISSGLTFFATFLCQDKKVENNFKNLAARFARRQIKNLLPLNYEIEFTIAYC
jgi:hypothetical protein